MSNPLSSIVYRLIGPQPLSTWGAESDFDVEAVAAPALARSRNAAFMLALAGPEHPAAGRAAEWLASRPDDVVAVMYLRLIDAVRHEVGSAADDVSARLHDSAIWCRSHPEAPWDDESRLAVWGALFPEGLFGLRNSDDAVAELRARRRVEITHPCADPISRPATEVLLTSNAMLGLPHSMEDLTSSGLSQTLQDRILEVAAEPQRYWFDHPIPIGVTLEANEVWYGLRGLNEAVAFEKQRRNAESADRVTVAMSVSTTHEGLGQVAIDCLDEALTEGEPLEHLVVHAFSEASTRRLLDEVLLPAAREYDIKGDTELLREVFGVDGMYGRHYSFLKAIAALWSVLVDPNVKATFKIDLDQVFPQIELVEQGGGSAFEQFRTRLWGAEARDHRGRNVELGMLAGALVNERDISSSLFTPDVTPPADIPAGEGCVFYNRLPMALSTEAEMMAQYREDCDLDGDKTALQRVHVTGGTNGIRVDALRRHRPFTPTFVGRAEDQAYLLSVLFDGATPLRYVHRAGLIMRHDKEAFAGPAISAAKSGRFVGDLVRTIVFSRYAEFLPGGMHAVKEEIDPFTGCFVSHLPVTLVALRLGLHVADIFRTEPESVEPEEIQQMAADRLLPLIECEQGPRDPLLEQWQRERDGWNLYYEILDRLERELADNDPSSKELRDVARRLVSESRLDIGRRLA